LLRRSILVQPAVDSVPTGAILVHRNAFGFPVKPVITRSGDNAELFFVDPQGQLQGVAVPWSREGLPISGCPRGSTLRRSRAATGERRPTYLPTATASTFCAATTIHCHVRSMWSSPGVNCSSRGHPWHARSRCVPIRNPVARPLGRRYDRSSAARAADGPRKGFNPPDNRQLQPSNPRPTCGRGRHERASPFRRKGRSHA
jgi:hypothetical protein